MTFLRVYPGEIVTDSVIRGDQEHARTEENRVTMVRDAYTKAALAAGSGVAEPRRTEGIVDCSRATAWVVTRGARGRDLSHRGRRSLLLTRVPS